MFRTEALSKIKLQQRDYAETYGVDVAVGKPSPHLMFDPFSMAGEDLRRKHVARGPVVDIWQKLVHTRQYDLDIAAARRYKPCMQVVLLVISVRQFGKELLTTRIAGQLAGISPQARRTDSDDPVAIEVRYQTFVKLPVIGILHRHQAIDYIFHAAISLVRQQI